MSFNPSSHSRSIQGKIPVGLLGCTGVVGQRFIELLSNHPYFQLTTLAASERSAGKLYQEIVQWKLTSTIPEDVLKLMVYNCQPQYFKDCVVVFSALDASVAGEIEIDFAKAGLKVFSNARNHRYDETVPILIPHANASHLSIIPHQQSVKGYTNGGYIITNANCSSTGLVIALQPILQQYGIEKLFVVTMQAISGAGYPGVSAMDITDNVVPYISGEEPKMEMEPQKILGTVEDGKRFVNADFAVSATCNRVNTIDGHMECVSIKLKTPATPEQIRECLINYTSEAQTLGLPSAPARPIIVVDADNRPQPRLDRDTGRGMVVTVGRVRKCPLFDIKFTLCSHNTIIGAAGGSIQNAELAAAKGLL